MRAVAIGGGHGLSRCLAALATIADHVTAVVTAADDGGSSGRLRRDLGVLPPGDLRKALGALSPRGDVVELLEVRFDTGDLAGHSLGNLMIVAAVELEGGDPVAGLDRIARLLEIRGRVLPSTTVPVELRARLDAGDPSSGAPGEEVAGQARVARSRRVDTVWLEPPAPPATPAALDAIADADLVVLGPGSLYTSILPNLLVPDIAAGVAAAACPVVYVANLREQPGETEGVSLPAHLAALHAHVPGLELAATVVHEGPEPQGAGLPLRVVPSELEPYTRQVVAADVYDRDDAHDPERLAAVLAPLARASR